MWERFADAVEPLRAAGRLGAVLFQFPPWVAPWRRRPELLEECAGGTDGRPGGLE
ncbi:DUF72 domain-containing protein, partial [Streptomyces scabiei]|uniref:DUF72 domain-containing protein n=1 Tax=Streptomyces scabiei TaxID=1930 RepID=UPI0038D4346C